MAKKLAIVFGVVFIAVGLLSFVDNGIVGSNGFFATDLNHDIVHLLTGIVLLFVGLKKPESSAKALKVFAVIYLVVTVLGFVLVPQGGSLLGLIFVSSSDHILHLVLGVVIYVLASLSQKHDNLSLSNQEII